MYCSKCGKENPEGARFCMHCSADLNGYRVEISPKIEPRITVSPEVSILMSDMKMAKEPIGKALEKTTALKAIQEGKTEFTPEEEQAIDTLHKMGKEGTVIPSKYNYHDLERCAEFLDTISEKRPEIKSDEWFWAVKGGVLVALGKYGEALDWFDMLLDRNPLSYVGWSNKGVVLEHFNRYDEAIRCFDKALEINEEIDFAWTEKCFLLSMQWLRLFKPLGGKEISMEEYEPQKARKIKKEGKRCINRALEINPKNERAWILKSALEGDKNEEIRCLNKALEINPRYADAMLQMGVVKYLSAIVFGETNFVVGWDRDLLWEAIGWFDKALRIDPYYTEALKNKEQVLKILRELP